MKATRKKEIFKLVLGHKMQRIFFFEVREKYHEKNL